MKTLTLNGMTQSLTAWAAQVGLDRSTIGQRLKKGWSVAAALNPKDTRGSHQKGRRWPEWVKKKIGAGVKRAGARECTRIRFVPFELIPDLLPNDQGLAKRDTAEEKLKDAPRSSIVAQGPCETTLTPRFQIKDCACDTYDGNLGPCLTWWQGAAVGRCVYCDHGLDCHVKLSKMLAPSEKHQADPKNAKESAVSAIVRKPTEAQADSVRGILQVIRGKTGATFPEVYEHCKLRGDDMSRWPQWARDEAGYVTESGAACLIYEVMARADDGVEKP